MLRRCCVSKRGIVCDKIATGRGRLECLLKCTSKIFANINEPCSGLMAGKASLRGTTCTCAATSASVFQISLVRRNVSLLLPFNATRRTHVPYETRKRRLRPLQGSFTPSDAGGLEYREQAMGLKGLECGTSNNSVQLYMKVTSCFAILEFISMLIILQKKSVRMKIMMADDKL